MLNRRTIRIKVMQTLFAYEQGKKPTSQSPNDNDTPPKMSLNIEVAEKRKQERQIRLDKKSELSIEPTHIPLPRIPTVDTTAQQAKIFEAKEVSRQADNMIVEATKINSWYYFVLRLLISFANIASIYKKTNHDVFVDNVFIGALRKSSEDKEKWKDDRFHWTGQQEQIQDWFHCIVAKDPTYVDYIQKQDPSLEDQRTIINYVVRKLILKGSINDYFFEHNLMWREDRDIIKSLVDKTLKTFDPKTATIALQQFSLDWKNDKIFMKTLFEETVNIDKENKMLIAQNTKNWEVDRLPLTDRIILEMAITELIHFPEIPIKVTLNEYIELAKRYSTPKSANFVNGIIDVIIKKLHATQTIKKSGKGLLDNK